jgi:hypothetical protein
MLHYFRKMLFILFVVFISTTVYTSVYAQYSYLGKTTNIVTGIPENNVTIFHKQLGEYIYSDINGAFRWDVGEVEENIKYRIIYNTFFSPEDENVALQIININGQKLFQTDKLGFGGTFLFPGLSSGIYLLNIISENTKTTFKIIASEYSIKLLQEGIRKEKLFYSPTRDTLIFSKEGFFEQEILLPKADTLWAK